MKCASTLVLSVMSGFAVFLASAVTGADKEGEEEKVLEKLQGEWMMVSAGVEGRELDKLTIKGCAIAFKAGKFIRGGGRPGVGQTHDQGLCDRLQGGEVHQSR